jgi:EpsD family peptidyl-prolyl cis-trans isomerase
MAFGLVACGGEEEKKVASQLAAKVGKAEITVHQINQALGKVNATAASPEAAKTMSREVLEKLIDQQLAIEQATLSKLDRTPEVLSQIEASRRDIIARAYLQKVASALPKPSIEELKKYYADNPQLFSQRRIYNLQEIVVPTTENLTEQFRTFTASPKSVEEATAWLNGKGIKFRGRAIRMDAEQIPLEALARLHQLKDGQSLMVESPQGITLIRIAASQSAPVAEAQALPRIEAYLANRNNAQAMAEKFKELRASSEISYVGDFVKTEAPAAVAAAAPLGAASEPSADEKAKANLEKGIAGLK